jgi:hypothetical protein
LATALISNHRAGLSSTNRYKNAPSIVGWSLLDDCGERLTRASEITTNTHRTMSPRKALLTGATGFV